MAEQFARCRFWPDCAIHLGQRRPGWFSPANYAQMREDLADGLTYARIAALFDTSENSVHSIFRDGRTGRRDRRYRPRPDLPQVGG